jgi:hypothetical protein
MDKCDTIKEENKSYNKNKRQIYVWTENKEFFDNLKNKSKFINLLIKKYRTEVSDETLVYKQVCKDVGDLDGRETQ